MPGVLFFRRSDHFDHERFLTGDTVSWGNDAKNPDSLGITGSAGHARRPAAAALPRLLDGVPARLRLQDGRERKYAFDEHRAPTRSGTTTCCMTRCRAVRGAQAPLREAPLPRGQCSPGSALEVFEKMAFEDAVKAAASECGKPIRTDGWYEPIPSEPPPQEAAR